MQRIQLTKLKAKYPRGFTVVELAVVVVVVGVIFPVFSMLIINTYRDTFILDDQQKATSNIMQALWYMDDSIRTGNAFLATVPTPYTDAYGANSSGSSGGQAWSYKGRSATDRFLIVKNYATTTNAINTGRQPVFRNTSDFNCTTEMYYQPQLSYLTIFFVKDNNLYKRLLTDTVTALCPGNAQNQKQTCPPYITTGRHASCQANDELLVSNVTSFTLEYYQITADGSSVQIDPTYTSTDPDILVAADYVNVSVSASGRANATPITLTQRMTKVNQ